MMFSYELLLVGKKPCPTTWYNQPMANSSGMWILGEQSLPSGEATFTEKFPPENSHSEIHRKLVSSRDRLAYASLHSTLTFC